MLKPSLLDISHLDHPAISISVSKRDAKLAGTRDGALLEVVVNNALPCVRTLFSRSREMFADLSTAYTNRGDHCARLWPRKQPPHLLRERRGATTRPHNS